MYAYSSVPNVALGCEKAVGIHDKMCHIKQQMPCRIVMNFRAPKEVYKS
jgi:hypothetical protein